MNRKISATFILACFAAAPSYAVNIDLDSLMSAKAQSEVNVRLNACLNQAAKISNWIERAKANSLCKVMHPNPVNFINVEFSPGAVRTSNLQQLPYANAVETRVYYRANCGSTIAQISETWSTSVSNQVSTTTKDSVKTVKSGGVSLSLEVVSAEAKYDKEVFFERAETITESETKTHSLNIQKTMPAYTGLLVTVDFRKYGTALDFDGDVYVQGFAPFPGATYSALVNGDNKITVRGSILVSDHETGSIVYKEVPIDPVSCQTISSTKMSFSKINAKTTTKEESDSKEVTDNYFLINKIDKTPTKTISKLDSLLSVTTANVLANVRVRARALGEKTCLTTLHSGKKSNSILAPANRWSEWSNLETHTGTETFNIFNETNCQTPVEVEVSYFK